MRRQVIYPSDAGYFLKFCSFLLPVALFLFCCVNHAFSQETDTLIVENIEEAGNMEFRDHSPQKAAMYSAVLPGLGQIYNKKYWKVPIVYVGFGTFVYFIFRNDIRYQEAKDAYIVLADDNPENDLLAYNGLYTLQQVDFIKNTYKNWRDLSIILTGAFYVFQIIDATVDAYMIDFDINENLSMRLSPSLLDPGKQHATLGLKCCVYF